MSDLINDVKHLHMEIHKNPDMEFLGKLPGPARRALERRELITLQMLASTTREELLNLHGFGPGAVRTIDQAMKKVGLKFRE